MWFCINYLLENLLFTCFFFVCLQFDRIVSYHNFCTKLVVLNLLCGKERAVNAAIVEWQCAPNYS